MRLRSFAIGALACASTLFAPSVLAAGSGVEGYPTRAVRLIDANPPGGVSDLLARLLAQRVSERWQASVIVENRPGAAGAIGAEHVAKSVPDGHTFILAHSSYAVNPSLIKLSYDPIDGIAPVGTVATGPFVIVVHPSLPVQNVRELVALAKERPNQIDYASTGPGSIPHLVTELFNFTAGVKLRHIPYKGMAPAVFGVVSGQVHVLFASTTPALPHVKSGKLRALAVTTPVRVAVLPNVPTVKESGVPDYESNIWYGLWGPKGLSDDIVKAWNREINQFVHDPEMIERFSTAGLNAAPGSPDDFRDLLRRDIERWKQVVKAAGIARD
jgi:tripartite-type tricarboxylate transporter receptor subunit TctC